MDKKGQVLILVLWVLVALTMLAVSLGVRMSMAMRIARFEKGRLVAHYAARAGLEVAINALRDDAEKAAGFDAATEAWANSEESFQKITIGENVSAFSSVQYTYLENDEEKTRYGMRDEESKLNINKANQAALASLLRACGAEDGSDVSADELAKNIFIWIGKLPDDTDKIYEEGLGYPAKGTTFTSCEELVLVKGITPQIYQKILPYVSIYAADKVNANTVLAPVLTALLSANAQLKDNAEDISRQIVSLRVDVPFASIDEIKNKLAIPTQLKGAFGSFADAQLDVKSRNFLIEVCGWDGKIKSIIRAVYDRQQSKITYYHEG